MNHKHRKTLHALFAHPVSANIDPHAVEAVIAELGGSVEERHGGRIALSLNGHTEVYRRPGHSLPPSEVQQLRRFIETCGVDPERDFPL